MERIYYESQDNLTRCQCKDCGKHFFKGDEGDNEKYCLRCEAISVSECAYDFDGPPLDGE